MSEFFRFPHTPHLAWLGTGQPRDDKVLTMQEVKELLRDNVVVEEKLDGANLGFSLSAEGELHIQNRGQYLQSPFLGQFSRLSSWLTLHHDAVKSALTQDLILFGEWCAARHTLGYTKLPDLFLGFDVYDRKSGRFWNSMRRNRLLSEIGIAPVPQRHQGKTDLEELTRLLASESSLFHAGPMEGLVVRKEDENWLINRAKLVRMDFTQAITEHWSRRKIEWNRLASQSSTRK